MDAVAARHEAGALKAAYRKTFMSTRAHYAGEARKAWWQADKDFLITHRAALEAADPAGFRRVLGAFTEGSSPSARPSPARPAAAATGNARAVLGRDGIVADRTPGDEISGLEVIPAPAQAAMAGEWRHLRQVHGADPAAVARDAPDPEMAGLIHDAAHEYPVAPWGEVVVLGQAEAWWQARDWEQEWQPKEDPAEWRAFFREVLGLDMPLNADHQARLNRLDADGLLTPDMWTEGPEGDCHLHGFDAAAMAAERGGLLFPHLYQRRYTELRAAATGPGGLAAALGRAQLAAASFPGPAQLNAPGQEGHDAARRVAPPTSRMARGGTATPPAAPGRTS
jgi:hypothetical protein